MQKKTISIIFIVVALLVGGAYLFFSQETEQFPAKKVAIIQYFSSLDEMVNAFKVGLKDIGYEEGKNITYSYQSAEGDQEAMQAIAEQAVSQNPDLIYAVTSVSGRAAKAATERADRMDIPIIFAHADHPVETGLVESMESSGNNTTGIAINLGLLVGKKLEFLTSISPTIVTIGTFRSTYSDPAADFVLEELRRQSASLHVRLKEYVIENSPGSAAVREMQILADTVTAGDINALFVLPGPVANLDASQGILVSLTKRLKIPSAFLLTNQVTAGGLLSYSHDFTSIGLQAARMAQKVFRGEKPSNIPLEVPEKNILAINLKTAQEIGVIIPDTLQSLADHIFRE